MLIDSRTLPDGYEVDSDICIVGAGVAGITLAREFMASKVRVCLLESGGVSADKDTQFLYDGVNVGHPYYPLETARSRQFGGSSNRWLLEIGDDRIGARLRPFDEIDFEQRHWVPHSGWPFKKADIDAYYLRAHEVCKAGPYPFASDYNNDVRSSFFKSGGGVETAIYSFVARDVFTVDYRKELEEAQNITTYTYANVLEVVASESVREVTRLRAATLSGNEFQVRSRIFVLASGGIEIPRLLLLSKGVQSSGLGNQNDLVGRFFMEHPHLWSGVLVPSDVSVVRDPGIYQMFSDGGYPLLGQLTLSDALIRKKKLLNQSTFLQPGIRKPRAGLKKSVSEGTGILKKVMTAVRTGDLNAVNRHLSTLFPVVNDFSIAMYRKAAKLFYRIENLRRHDIFLMNHMAEQTPNPDSRVSLSLEKDAFNQNKVQLDWRLCGTDVQSILRSQEIMNDIFRSSGLGSIDIELDGSTIPEDLHGGWHHMGTTRMHNDPKQGVVDENAKVHEISNLYIAGPSIFPTSGYANPVLTIVALTLRLAELLKTKL